MAPRRRQAREPARRSLAERRTDPLQAGSFRTEYDPLLPERTDAPPDASRGGTLTLTPVGANSVLLTNSGAPGENFAIGGSITIAPATVDGVYTGTVNVQVDYN